MYSALPPMVPNVARFLIKRGAKLGSSNYADPQFAQDYIDIHSPGATQETADMAIDRVIDRLIETMDDRSMLEKKFIRWTGAKDRREVVQRHFVEEISLITDQDPASKNTQTMVEEINKFAGQLYDQKRQQTNIFGKIKEWLYKIYEKIKGNKLLQEDNLETKIAKHVRKHINSSKNNVSYSGSSKEAVTFVSRVSDGIKARNPRDV